MQIIWNMKNQEFMTLTGLFWAMPEFMNHPQIRIQVFWFPFGISLEAEKWKVTMMGIVTRTSQTIQAGASLPLTPWMAVL